MSLEYITLKSSSSYGIVGLGSPYFHKLLRMNSSSENREKMDPLYVAWFICLI